MSVWWRRNPGQGSPSRRLVCFPHAGGTAGAFLSWTSAMPAGTEVFAVQYPGRQERMLEPCIEDMHQMADRIAAELANHLDLPMLLFGHSMGSAVAYEVALRLEHRHDFKMHALFVSGRTSPHRIDGEHRHQLPDADLVAAMRALGGPDVSVFRNAQLLPLILPPLRADLRLLDAHRPATVEALNAPIVAYGGDEDFTCPVDDLYAWQDATTAGIQVRTFSGGHHFLRTAEKTVLAALSQQILTFCPH